MALQQQTLDPMRRGDSYTFEATVTQADGTPVDLTAWSVRSTGKYHPTDSDSAAIYQVTKANGITVTGADNNIARVVIPAAATAVFTTNVTFWWDVQIASGGLVYTVALGTLSAFLDISQTAP